MTDPTRAVFLSYASQDAEAARRICEALRAVGIEVWFDQSELRGGDAWDQKIHHQIRDCALFVPIISANTAARPEGYFRLEWALADRRTEMIARNKPFVVPVCIDRTPDNGADVPDSFQKVQWTRLSGGETPTAFCERISVLLGSVEAAARSPSIESPARTALPNRSSHRWTIVAAAGAVIAMAGGWQAWRLSHIKLGPRSITVATQAVPEKSIAVLPFVDMSEKHDQEYFSDGLSEELIDHLAHSPDLKVIGRTSSFAFKGKNEDMRTIAAKLGVANLLEGSVRKAGAELRITAQLVRASDGVHLWSQSFDRKFADIFKVQEEISDTVAKALNVALAGRARTPERGTSNVEAYNLMLQGYYYFMRGNAGDNERAVVTYQRALKLDPQYAVAWAELARVYAWQGYVGELPAAEADLKGRDAVRRALANDPNCAVAYYARGNIFRFVAGDWTAATPDFERAATLDPHGEIGYQSQGNILLLKTAKSGQFGDYLDWAHGNSARNPLDTEGLADLASIQQAAGLLDEAAATSRKLLELNPALAFAPAQYAQTLLLLGRKAEALLAVEKESDPASKLSMQACVYWALGRRAESDTVLGALEHGFASRNPYMIAVARAYRGEVDLAFLWLERTYQQRRGALEALKIDPLLRDLHGDPRFKALLRKMKLPET